MRKIIKKYKSAPIIIAVIIVLLNSACSSKTEDSYIDKLLQTPTASDIYNESNRLEVTSGTSNITRSDGTSEEIKAETTVSVGDKIVISEDGSATLYWFDDSVSRLNGGTELRITKADYDIENLGQIEIDMELIKGEVWSKVSALIDDKSSFQAGSGSIIAGVRGTVFNLISTDTEVQIESIGHVAYFGTEESETNILQGKWGKINKDLLPASKSDILVGDIPEDRYQEKWIINNQKKEKDDLKRFTKERKKKIKELAGTLPGNSNYYQKHSEIQLRIDSFSDPNEKIEAEVTVALLKITEAIAMLNEGLIEKLGSEHFEKALTDLKSIDVPAEIRISIRDKTAIHFQILLHLIESILPEEIELYKAKIEIRADLVALQQDLNAENKLEKLFDWQMLFEFHDFVQGTSLSDQEIKDVLSNFHTELEKLRDFVSTRAASQIFYNKIKSKTLEQVSCKGVEQANNGDILVVLRHKEDGRCYLKDLFPEPSPKDLCPEGHYHAHGSITSFDGYELQDIQPCGQGMLSEFEEKTILFDSLMIRVEAPETTIP